MSSKAAERATDIPTYRDVYITVDRSEGGVIAVAGACDMLPQPVPSHVLDLIAPQDHPLLRRMLREGHDAEVVNLVSASGPRRAFAAYRSLPDGQAELRLTAATTNVSTAVDPLTGLANREAALRRLETVERDHSAVMFCDLDGFKSVNDSHGHSTGDQILRQVAGRFTHAATPNDFIARLGGDEFLIICTNISGQSDAEARARRFREFLRPPFDVEEATLWLDASIGIVLPEPDATAEELLWNADAAMYEAKRLRSGTTMFTDSLSSAARARRQLERDLRSAVARNQLHVVYQPVLEIKTARVVGCEALVRWTHPEQGLIPPSQFVPMAENLGIIDEIGTFVLNAALDQMNDWLTQDPHNAPDFVAVNVSAHQLVRPAFADTVHAALMRTKLPGQRLSLEITETALIADPNAAAATLTDLTDLNVTFDIDDFGTGYSNLANLIRLPVHALKIDASFTWTLIDDDRTQAAIKALLTLAEQLNMKVITEGVETAEQLKWLADHGCDMAQGYHISVPRNGRDLLTFIRDRVR